MKWKIEANNPNNIGKLKGESLEKAGETKKNQESTAETSKIVGKIKENKPNKGGKLRGESLEKAGETKKNQESTAETSYFRRKNEEKKCKESV